ncbi:GNAT family N-acetyltransferase [Parasphingorhabdus sp. JC815]|uniref:GNAT family N-acetyltransferase n=1 Tax=Parasphingorhabdus sp. JC815 TaxID=3232140 RepID=UPI0034580E03
MSDKDIDGVMAVAEQAFPDHPEEVAVFKERLALYPAGCFALADPSDTILGYCISYPWELGAIPPLNSPLGTVPKESATLYLHDLALHHDARSQGYTKEILHRLDEKMAQQNGGAIALVSVNSSVPFWESNGFVVQSTPALTKKLESYGADARYMVKNF